MKKTIVALLAFGLVLFSCSGSSTSATDAWSEMAPANMDQTAYQAFIKSDKLVLVDFYADWCRPCRQMEPSLEAIANEMDDELVIKRVNTDENPAIVEAMGIRTIPCFILYKGNEKKWQQEGSLPKETLEKLIHDSM